MASRPSNRCPAGVVNVALAVNCAPTASASNALTPAWTATAGVSADSDGTGPRRTDDNSMGAELSTSSTRPADRRRRRPEGCRAVKGRTFPRAVRPFRIHPAHVARQARPKSRPSARNGSDTTVATALPMARNASPIAWNTVHTPIRRTRSTRHPAGWVPPRPCGCPARPMGNDPAARPSGRRHGARERLRPAGRGFDGRSGALRGVDGSVSAEASGR